MANWQRGHPQHRSDLNHGNNAGDTPLLLSLTHPNQRKCERNGGMWPVDNDHYLHPQVGEVRVGNTAAEVATVRFVSCMGCVNPAQPWLY